MLKIIKKRRSIRRYQQKPVEEEKLNSGEQEFEKQKIHWERF